MTRLSFLWAATLHVVASVGLTPIGADDNPQEVGFQRLPKAVRALDPACPNGWERSSRVGWRMRREPGIRWTLANTFERREPVRKGRDAYPAWQVEAVTTWHPNATEASQLLKDAFLYRAQTPPTRRGIPGDERLPADEVISSRHGNTYEVYARKGSLTVSMMVSAGGEAYLSDRDLAVANRMADDLLRRWK